MLVTGRKNITKRDIKMVERLNQMPEGKMLKRQEMKLHGII